MFSKEKEKKESEAKVIWSLASHSYGIVSHDTSLQNLPL